jgi:hypothetical protein
MNDDAEKNNGAKSIQQIQSTDEACKNVFLDTRDSTATEVENESSDVAADVQVTSENKILETF